MRNALFILALVASATAAAADQTARSSFAPLVEVSEEVGRKASKIVKSVEGAELKPAGVSDIDLNGDGHISFEELARFESKPVSF